MTMAGVAAAATVIGITPAFAAKNDYAFTTDAKPGGRANFRASGEYIEACDIQADGYRVKAWAMWIDSRKSWNVPVEDANGSGNDCVSRKIDVPEGKKVTIKVCLQDGAKGTPKFCGYSRHGVA